MGFYYSWPIAVSINTIRNDWSNVISCVLALMRYHPYNSHTVWCAKARRENNFVYPGKKWMFGRNHTKLNVIYLRSLSHTNECVSYTVLSMLSIWLIGSPRWISVQYNRKQHQLYERYTRHGVKYESIVKNRFILALFDIVDSKLTWFTKHIGITQFLFFCSIVFVLSFCVFSSK